MNFWVRSTHLSDVRTCVAIVSKAVGSGDIGSYRAVELIREQFRAARLVKCNLSTVPALRQIQLVSGRASSVLSLGAVLGGRRYNHKTSMIRSAMKVEIMPLAGRPVTNAIIRSVTSSWVGYVRRTSVGSSYKSTELTNDCAPVTMT